MTDVGVMLPRDLPAGLVLDFARAADRAGFDELWVVEDLAFRGGVAQAAAVLAATDRIVVGVGILPAAVRHVAYAAMEVATLAQLFPGRVHVGIGHGMPEWMRQLGVWPQRPLAFLSSYVETLRTLLGGGEVDGLRLDPSSVPDVVPPLLLGVRGPKSLAVSGRVADGTVLAEPCAPEYARAALEKIAASGPHRVVAYNVGAVDDDPAAAVAAARPALEWVGEPDWAPHLAPLPFADEFAALRTDCATRAEFVARLPEAWVRRLALVGTPDEVRGRIAELGRAGVSSSVFIPAGPDPLRSLAALGRVL
ncbi:LLM class flavin-dependent oxidoreductase [Cellulomonas composti]|nr:LLM class flavin-dependent oxidoreductase [Cellulomonas composti]